MKGLIKNGISKTQLSIHAWLTLPTCEIMDFTIQTTSAVINKAKKGLGGVYAGHTDHLSNNIRYHPRLLGEKYFLSMAITFDPISAIEIDPPTIRFYSLFA